MPNIEIVALDRVEIIRERIVPEPIVPEPIVPEPIVPEPIVPEPIVPVRIGPEPWAFAAERRDAIDRHFAALKRQRPAIWNGRVLLLNRYSMEDGVLRGTCFETDYASFSAWRDWGFPDGSVHNFFAAAALQAADGAYLVGEMGPDTASAGQLYFPCGTPEPADIDPSGAFAIDANLYRELDEETGLAAADLEAERGWTLVRDRGFVGLLKRLTAKENAEQLRARVLRYINDEERPELSNIRIVRSPADFDPAMLDFVTAYLTYCWA